MKSELRHLLDKLKADYSDFQNITISSTGVTFAMRRHGIVRFESLNALEEYAYLRAQSFPETTLLPANQADAIELIGNAVPPIMAEAILRQL